MTKFGLLNKETNELMRVSVTAFGHYESLEYTLVTYGDSIWLTSRQETAEKVAVESSDQWYECDDHDSPRNEFVGELEVVEVDISVKGNETHKNRRLVRFLFVHINKDLGPDMGHFDNDMDAIVDRSNGYDNYSLYLIKDDKVIGQAGWYKQHQLTVLEKQNVEKAIRMVKEYDALVNPEL